MVWRNCGRSSNIEHCSSFCIALLLVMKLFLCVLVPLLCPRLSHGSTLLEAVREAVQMMEVPSDYWAVQVHGGASKATQLAHKHRLQLLGTVSRLITQCSLFILLL